MIRLLLLGLPGVVMTTAAVDGQVVNTGPANAAAEIQRLPQIEQLVMIEPQGDPPPKRWEGSFELGLDGTQGNTETFNFRFGFDAERKTELSVLSLDLDYNKKTERALETANRAFLGWRLERLFRESRFSGFVHGTVDYDEFQAFNVRVAVDTGLGYKLIEAERTTLSGRLGGGFSREIGGPDDNYAPEATFALDFEHRLSDRQKLTATTEYAPRVTAMEDYRLNSQAAWEVVLDRQTNLGLKLSVLNRYDSTPHGRRPNDVDYSATLLWQF